MTRYFLIFALGLLILSCNTDTDGNNNTLSNSLQDEIYFPPIDTEDWATISPNELGWNEAEIQGLISFLEQKNTKSFIILHKGKIALEVYLNGHNQNSIWYWASAGKTLSTAICGIAQNEGLLNINDKVSDYLGNHWTSLSLEKEQLITIKHLLSMTSGLDDSVGDGVSPENLQYLADAGTRWAYHNVYVKVQDVIASASNQSWDSYFKNNLRDKIGMNGTYINIEDLNVYWSNTRSMARFGLLIYANGRWDQEQIVPKSFLEEATSSSQNLNLSYGYLWWINGQDSYLLPQSQIQFSGSIIPNAPNDMYAALGKNDQKIYIVPSKELVIIRMGESADDVNFALSNFDNNLWEKINAVID